MVLNLPDTAQPARRKLFILIAIIVAIFLVGAIGYLWLDYAVKTPLDADNAPTQKITIANGMGVSAIGDLLAKQKIIAGAFPFKYYVWKTGKKNEFKTGTFDVSPSQNIPEIVDQISGLLSGEARVTIVEGWTNKDIKAVLSEKLVIESAGKSVTLAQREERERDFDVAVGAPYNYEWLADVPSSQKLEGYLFPDTYRFFRDAPMGEVVQKMLQNFDQKLTAERRVKIAASGFTTNQVITLAGIVQKEAVEKDMPVVAGIFIERLREKQKLQSDATVNYVTGKQERQPSAEDTRIDSPYNTYRYAGLPPGPICNPGLAAIDAVLDPQTTDYRYFLNAPDGQTIYSRTYEEHLEQKKKYLDQVETAD